MMMMMMMMMMKMILIRMTTLKTIKKNLSLLIYI